MKVVYSRQAAKYLNKLDRPRYNQVINAIEKIEYGERDIKRVKGLDNLYRLRTGNYRVLFGIEDGMIKVDKIKVRGDVYHGLK